MARASRLLGAVLLSALVIAGCGRAPQAVAADAITPAVEAAQADVADVVAPATADAQLAAAEVLVPATLALQEAVQDVLPPAPPANDTAWAGAEAATALIIRWEIGSPAQYARKYEGVICPGGASGPTLGLGYDLGHQTPADIRAAWSDHPDVERLASASGVVGDAACRAWVAQHRDIRTPYAHAERVFRESSLPAYRDAAARALGASWDAASLHAQAAAASMGYNRGWSMRGDRNREKRALRDDCAGAGDCYAVQLRSMKRLWPDVRGLRDRREAEAVVAERRA